MKFKMLAFGLAMWTFGYCIGSSDLPEVSALTAQEDAAGVSQEASIKIQEANQALKSAMDALVQDGKYEGLSETPNAYLILSGGGNAKEDLASGQGVDPETFAALYARQVNQDILDGLTVDDQGRLLHNEQLIRLWSKTRLERTHAERIKLSLAGNAKSPFGSEK